MNGFSPRVGYLLGLGTTTRVLPETSRIWITFDVHGFVADEGPFIGAEQELKKRTMPRRSPSERGDIRFRQQFARHPGSGFVHYAFSDQKPERGEHGREQESTAGSAMTAPDREPSE